MAPHALSCYLGMWKSRRLNALIEFWLTLFLWVPGFCAYAEALRSGSADCYTEILRELLSRSRSSKLSAGDQQSLNQAIAMFIGEVSVALDRTRDEVEADLRSIPAAAG